MRYDPFKLQHGFLSNTVAFQGFLGEVFGSKPQIAPYIPTDFSVEQLKAIEEDISAFPQFEQLGSQYYDYMLGMFNKAIPGFSNILDQGGKLTQEMQSTAATELAGKIPQDVADQVFRSSAFKSLESGTAGSPMGNALAPRQLGLTSLDLIQQGGQLDQAAGNAAQRWAGLASGLMLNPAGFLVSPQQQAELTMQNNLYRQATQQRQFNVNAQPNPALQALNQWVEQIGGAVIGSYLGAKPGTNYKTSYDPSQYGTTDPLSDVTTPGHYVTPGGSGNPAISPGASLNLGGFNQPNDPSSFATSTSLAGPQGAPIDLWNSFNTTGQTDPFGINQATGGPTSSMFAPLPVYAAGGLPTDLSGFGLNVAQTGGF